MSDRSDAEDRAIERALGGPGEAAAPGADEGLVEEYRAVLSHLSLPEIRPGAELEERVVAAALARRPAAAPALRPARRRRSTRIRVVALACATVAAAVVIALIVTGRDSGSPTTGGHVTLATVHGADVDALLRAPGTRTGDFGSTAGRVALGTDGNGAIYDLGDDAAPLQIGLVSAGGTTLIGPAQPVGGAVAFVVDHPDRVTAVTLVRDGREIARSGLRPR